MQLSGVCVAATASKPARPQTEEACSLNLTLLTAGQRQTRLGQKGNTQPCFNMSCLAAALAGVRK